MNILFIVTAAGTFASNMKLFYLTFLRERPRKYENVEPEPLPMKIAMGVFAAAILFIGFFPNWLLKTAIGPGLASFGFDPISHGYHLRMMLVFWRVPTDLGLQIELIKPWRRSYIQCFQ